MIGRLPLKRADYASQCLGLIEGLLYDEDLDVKKAVSFAKQLAVRGDIGPVHVLLSRYVPPENPAATWVLCDVIRSMAKDYLSEFVDLLPLYKEWKAAQSLTTKERLSIQSAIQTLEQAIE